MSAYKRTNTAHRYFRPIRTSQRLPLNTNQWQIVTLALCLLELKYQCPRIYLFTLCDGNAKGRKKDPKDLRAHHVNSYPFLGDLVRAFSSFHVPRAYPFLISFLFPAPERTHSQSGNLCAALSGASSGLPSLRVAATPLFAERTNVLASLPLPLPNREVLQCKTDAGKSRTLIVPTPTKSFKACETKLPLKYLQQRQEIDH